jgi:hypothetical protein
MRRESSDVEIKDPAVKQMKEKSDKSCLKRGCSKGCIFFILLFVAFLFILKFTASSQVKEVKQVPKKFPNDIPVYEQEGVHSIRIRQAEQNVFAQVGNIFPKFILVSAYLTLGENSPQELKNYLEVKNHKLADKNLVAQFWTLMSENSDDKKEKIIIEWKNLAADPDFLQQFYQSSLENNNYSVKITTDKTNQKQLLFNKQNYVGRVYIKDKDNNQGTNSMSLHLVIN